MITPAYVRLMADYNAEMNRRLYAAAAGLSDEARKADRGAFWRSIHGTLAHILWGDRQWMARLAGWPPNTIKLAESASTDKPFEELRAERVAADADLIAWASTLNEAALAADLSWWSGAMQADQHRPVAMLVVHLFNHQTHHRGQVHAMLTAAGATTGATDLPFILP